MAELRFEKGDAVRDETDLREAGEGIDIREAVRERYAAAATRQGEGCCGGESSCGSSAVPAVVADVTSESGVFGGSLYEVSDREAVPGDAIGLSLGCGNPTAVAELHEGETVLDLGSGTGTDVLLSARRVGPAGKAYGLDMTDEMLELARANAQAAGVANVEFVKGYIEDIPLPDGSVDVVISNCVINLSGDKPRVIAQVARVLKPGGRVAVSDVIADPDMDDETKRSLVHWTGCIAGALTRAQFETALRDAGLTDIEIVETHRVHRHAGAAIVRAHKPG
jgi:SAM-dependent methyltransferase